MIPNAPEVQTDARRAHQQEPRALALNPKCATSTPLTMQGSRGPERNRRAVQLCGSHPKDPFFSQPSILECTASAHKRPGRCHNIKALPSPQRDSPEVILRGAAVTKKGRAPCSGSGTTIKRVAANWPVEPFSDNSDCSLRDELGPNIGTLHNTTAQMRNALEFLML